MVHDIGYGVVHDQWARIGIEKPVPFHVELVHLRGSCGSVSGELLEHAKAFVDRPGEDGYLGSLGHRLQIVDSCGLRVDHVLRGGVQGVKQDDVYGTAVGSGVEVGVNAGGQLRQNAGCELCCAGLLETANGLRFAIFLDSEVGLLETVDWPAVVVGDDDIDDSLARVDLNCRRTRLRCAVLRQRRSVVHRRQTIASSRKPRCDCNHPKRDHNNPIAPHSTYLIRRYGLPNQLRDSS